MNVGDDLGMQMWVARDSSAWCEPVFVQAPEGSEAIGERVRPFLSVEGVSGLVLAASVVLAILGLAERDHQPIPTSASTSEGSVWRPAASSAISSPTSPTVRRVKS